MRVYVVGRGAVGTYLGDLLRAGGAAVDYAPRALEEVVPIAADLAVVAVKSYATVGAVATLERALAGGPAPAILCPQNGLGNEERLAESFGAAAVVACALTVPVAFEGGRAVATGRGGIGLAPVGAEAHNWLAAAFGQSGVPVRVCRDYRALKWSKLALNVIANASCAILDVEPRRVVRWQGIFDLEIRAQREVAAAMRALGLVTVDLPRYPVRVLQRVSSLPFSLARALLGGRIAGARGGKAPSLLLDLRAGKGRTEVEALNGAVARQAAALGLAAPVNAALARVLEALAADPARRDEFRERPEALLAEVARAG